MFPWCTTALIHPGNIYNQQGLIFRVLQCATLSPVWLCIAISVHVFVQLFVNLIIIICLYVCVYICSFVSVLCVGFSAVFGTNLLKWMWESGFSEVLLLTTSSYAHEKRDIQI